MVFIHKNLQLRVTTRRAADSQVENIYEWTLKSFRLRFFANLEEFFFFTFYN